MFDLKIEVLPASYGDCFLITCGSIEKTHILMDTGFVSTYDNFLKNRLIEINEGGNLLDLMVLTHVDADHISGGIKFLQENGSAQSPKIIKINEIWHNSLKHLNSSNSIDKPNEINVKQKEILRSIIMKGMPKEFQVRSDLPIGAKQGSALASFISNGGYNWNGLFEGNAILSDNVPEIKLNKDVSIVLLSPTSSNIKKLTAFWIAELSKSGYKSKINEDLLFCDVYEYLISNEKPYRPIDYNKNLSLTMDLHKLSRVKFIEDTSVVNGSSISFILKYGNKKVLFLGDAHPSVIESSLKKINNGVFYFDAIKISHHGSQFNTSPTLLDIIDSKRYILSTNGSKFKHPDLEAIARIVTRETGDTRQLFFNYTTEKTKFLDNEEMKKMYNYDVCILDNDFSISL